MASESGDMKLLGNFGKLLEFSSINPDSNPCGAKSANVERPTGGGAGRGHWRNK